MIQLVQSVYLYACSTPSALRLVSPKPQRKYLERAMSAFISSCWEERLLYSTLGQSRKGGDAVFESMAPQLVLFAYIYHLLA
jgi:hypothetical protein